MNAFRLFLWETKCGLKFIKAKVTFARDARFGESWKLSIRTDGNIGELTKMNGNKPEFAKCCWLAYNREFKYSWKTYLAA